MDRFNKTIQVKPQTGYHQEQFDIYGRQDRADQGGRERDRDRDRDRDRRGRGDRGERRERRAEDAPATEPGEAAAGAAAPIAEEKG